MSAEPGRHLQPAEEPRNLIVVDADSGERLGGLVGHVQPLEDAIAGLQRDVRGWSARYANLKRDVESEAKESPVWPAALRVFDYWRRTCKHPNSEWSLDRFEMIRPHLERLAAKKKGRPADPEARLKKAEEICQLAVDGIALDCYVSDRRNGTKKRHDGWHLIFEKKDKFEDRVNSAPLERIREVMGPPPEPEQEKLT